MLRTCLILTAILSVTACSRLGNVGRAPAFIPPEGGAEQTAMITPGLPISLTSPQENDAASLWTRTRGSLLGDRRASLRGDILTVVIEIDDKAEISNATNRSRSGNESMGIPQLLGIPQRVAEGLPTGATVDPLIQTNSSSASAGSGTVSRNEKLELRVAATIVDVLPNGVLALQGSQEVRVNFELRELLVSGYVRPEDVSRQNEITYDKIASARISYGGRGQITDVQQPRIGQQIADIILPF